VAEPSGSNADVRLVSKSKRNMVQNYRDCFRYTRSMPFCQVVDRTRGGKVEDFGGGNTTIILALQMVTSDLLAGRHTKGCSICKVVDHGRTYLEV
jgi:hypothetical protein